MATVARPRGLSSSSEGGALGVGPALVTVLVVMAVLEAGAVYKLSHHGRHEAKPAPQFSAGGPFVAGPRGAGSPVTTTTTAAAATASTAAATTTTSVAPLTTTSVARATGRPTTTPPSLTSAGLAPPAGGAYTYALSGSETATGAGTRVFPTRMTINVHGATGVDPKSQAVFDLSLSGTHSEREIVQWGSDGVSWTFEASQVQFGGATLTNQVGYLPPMLQIPSQLTAGKVVTGASDAVAGSTLDRVEDWSVKVLGAETLSIAGMAVPTVKVEVDRTTRPGASEDIKRATTFWYSPLSRIWVKFAEHLHGEQATIGVVATYDESFTATLVSFA